MRSVGVLCLALVLCGCGAKAGPSPYSGEIAITAAPVPMDPKAPDQVRRGAFTYAGGVALTSSDSARFGGLSDLRLAKNGDILSVSDEGALLTSRLILDAAGHVQGLDHARLEPLLGLDGKPLQGKLQGDSEGLAVWPNGDVMVSFERDHRIWIYPAGGGPPRPAPKPDVAMPENEGMEGLALAPSRGPDAYWVGIEGGSIWLCRLSAACVQDKGQVRPPLGYRLTGLTETPAGALAVLHHGWDPIRGSHIILWITQPHDGAPVAKLDKLAIAAPMTVDNFEGVEASAMPNGDVRFYLISDDNFSPTQRTLLLAFDWKPPQPLTSGSR